MFEVLVQRRETSDTRLGPDSSRRADLATVPGMKVVRAFLPLTVAVTLIGCGGGDDSTASTTARSTTTTESKRPTTFKLEDARDGVTRLAEFPECVIGPLEELAYIMAYYLPIVGVEFETVPGGFRCTALIAEGEPGEMIVTASSDVSQVDAALGAGEVREDNMYAGQILVTCADASHCQAFWISPDDDFYVRMELAGGDLDQEFMRKKFRLAIPVILGQMAAAVEES